MRLSRVNGFDSLLFLYFFTLHADQLSLNFSNFTLRINNLIALSLLIIYIVKFRFSLLKIDRRLILSLGLILFSIVLSLLFSTHRERCCAFLGWYLFTVIGYFLLPFFLIKYGDGERYFKLYLASFVCIGVYAFLQFAISCCGLEDPFASQRVVGTIARPNAFAYEPSYYALYMTPFVMLCNFQYLTAPLQPFFLFRCLSIRHIAIINVLFLISTSTSAVFAYGIFFFFLLFLWKKPLFVRFRGNFIKFLMGLFTLFSLVFVLFPEVMKEFYMKFFFRGFMEHHSFFERWVGIEIAWKVFLDHPILGVGLGGYPSYFMDNWMEGSRELRWLYPNGLGPLANSLKYFEPMNVMTEILASLGVVGLFSFVYLLTVFFKKFKHAVSIDPQMAYGLFFSVLVMLIVWQFNQGIFRTYIWVHFALALALMDRISLKIFPNDPGNHEGSHIDQKIPQTDSREVIMGSKIKGR